MGKLEQLRSKTTRPRTSRKLCMDGALQVEFEAAQARLEALSRESLKNPGGFAGAAEDPMTEAADEVASLIERMAESVEVFTFEALPPKAFADLQLAHPPRKDIREDWNQDTFVPALIAATCIEDQAQAVEVTVAGFSFRGAPRVFTESEARELCLDVLASSAQLDQLFDGAYRINVRVSDVPFSVLASKTLRGSEPS